MDKMYDSKKRILIIGSVVIVVLLIIISGWYMFLHNKSYKNHAIECGDGIYLNEIKYSPISASDLNDYTSTSETVSISKSIKMLMLMPNALAIFKSWSGLGLRIPYSYFFIVAEFMPDN